MQLTSWGKKIDGNRLTVNRITLLIDKNRINPVQQARLIHFYSITETRGNKGQRNYYNRLGPSHYGPLLRLLLNSPLFISLTELNGVMAFIAAGRRREIARFHRQHPKQEKVNNNEVLN